MNNKHGDMSTALSLLYRHLVPSPNPTHSPAKEGAIALEVSFLDLEDSAKVTNARQPRKHRSSFFSRIRTLWEIPAARTHDTRGARHLGVRLRRDFRLCVVFEACEEPRSATSESFGRSRACPSQFSGEGATVANTHLPLRNPHSPRRIGRHGVRSRGFVAIRGSRFPRASHDAR